MGNCPFTRRVKTGQVEHLAGPGPSPGPLRVRVRVRYGSGSVTGPVRGPGSGGTWSGPLDSSIGLDQLVVMSPHRRSARLWTTVATAALALGFAGAGQASAADVNNARNAGFESGLGNW